MPIMVKFYLNSFLLTLVMFGWYFIRVTESGALIEMAKGELAWFLVLFTIVWIVAELAVMVMTWARKAAFKNENPMDERQSLVELFSTRDAYYAISSIMVIFVLMALIPESWLGSYTLDGHEAVVFVCVAATSLAFAVQCLSYVLRARA